MMKRDGKKNQTRKGRQALPGFKQLSMLPQPDYNPIWPRQNTYANKALRKMLQGRKITALDFEKEETSQRLPAYIDILANKLGWPVLKEDIFVRMRKTPKARLFRKYYFDKEFIKSIKAIAVGAV